MKKLKLNIVLWLAVKLDMISDWLDTKKKNIIASELESTFGDRFNRNLSHTASRDNVVHYSTVVAPIEHVCHCKKPLHDGYQPTNKLDTSNPPLYTCGSVSTTQPKKKRKPKKTKTDNQ